MKTKNIYQNGQSSQLNVYIPNSIEEFQSARFWGFHGEDTSPGGPGRDAVWCQLFGGFFPYPLTFFIFCVYKDSSNKA
jgi:hypothetical protein